MPRPLAPTARPLASTARPLASTARPLALAGLLLALAGLAGCGSGAERTPAACLAGQAAYQRALRSAPGDVRLAGGTPIGDCLTPNQSAGDITRVGSALLAATTNLNAEARAAPRSPAPVRLGYLIGAVSAGAGDTGGIHANLVSRLTAAARFSPGGTPLDPALEAAYARGRAAGLRRG
ncbi:MAG: hypothetical protein U0R52_12810 [Solirubrobacterales bacterium]